MKSSARVMAVTAIVTLAAVFSAGAGAAVATKTKEVSVAKFAKTMCTAYNKVIDDQDFIEALGNEQRCHEIFPVTGG